MKPRIKITLKTTECLIYTRKVMLQNEHYVLAVT